jgi:hypothetical protein
MPIYVLVDGQMNLGCEHRILNKRCLQSLWLKLLRSSVYIRMTIRINLLLGPNSAHTDDGFGQNSVAFYVRKKLEIVTRRL